MKAMNPVKTAIFIVSILILPLFTASCNVNFSVSNPDIEKLTASAQKLLEAGDYKAAAARLESINDLNPNLPENHYNLGIAYYRMGEKEKTIESMKKALELKSDLPDAYYTLAVTYEDIAIEKEAVLEEEKDAQKKADITKEIIESYQKAQDNYASYVKTVKDPQEREKVLKRMNSLSEEEQKIAKGASESSN
jgi:tetratricopeptide (TPR) repeat protein